MDPKRNQDYQHERSEKRQEEREAAARRLREGGPPDHPVQPGVLSVVDAVRDVEFPKTIEELRDMVGDREVWTSKDKRFALKEVLRKLKEPDFVGIREFQSAVQRHWEGIEFLERAEETRGAGAGQGGSAGSGPPASG